MTNANTKIYDKSVDRAAMLRLYERNTSGKVEVILDGHAVSVTDLVAKSKLRGRDAAVFKAELETLQNKTYTETHNVSKRALLDLVADQTSYMHQTLDASIGSIWRTAKPETRIAEDIVLKKPLYNDVNLAAGWRNVSVAERQRLESVIRSGIAEGKSEQEIAVSIRKGNVFNISKSQSVGLVRTAVTSVSSQVDHSVYKANEKALQGWQYVAVLDSRTTPICVYRDGKVYGVDEEKYMPPAHFHCRSTTVPVVKSYEQFGELAGVAQVRRKNFDALTDKQKSFYDGVGPLKESYDTWLRRQPTEVQLRHLGDYNKVEIFRSGQLTVDRFSNAEGRSLSIKELRTLTDSGYAVPGDTKRFALAKEKLDAMQLWASRPDDFINDPKLRQTLQDYYLLQSGELDGVLSYTNYRGALIGTKKAARTRVLTTPPTEDNLKYNPVTGRYEDSRMYQPSPSALKGRLQLVDESEVLKPKDKAFINKFVNDLDQKMSINERAVIADNLRITFGRYRENAEAWTNVKGVIQGQIKYDVMNVSEYMETQIRKDANLLFKLKQDNYIDPVLGPIQLQDLHDSFLSNVFAKKRWEEKVAPSIGRKLRDVVDYKIPYKIRSRLEDKDIDAFYLRFAKRLSVADSPDRDQLAVTLGRDLYNMANYRGDRKSWYDLGTDILDSANSKGFYELETYGVQKRRMKSRMGGHYFGPYYDTFSVNLRIVEPRIQKYAQLTRKVDLGLRLGVTEDRNRLMIRKGKKTYYDRWYRDTGIPITSTDSFSNFPEELITRDMEQALNWAANSKFKVDPDFHDFINKLMMFEDDKGKAKYFNDLNKYREYIVERGDSYERFKAMKWLRDKDVAFSNHPFLDHRARIYERGLIGPQSGETFRPFLNTSEAKNFSKEGYNNLQDQIGSFLGGLSDKLEGRFNSLSITGRQKIAEKWRPELVKIGNHMIRAKPADIRAVLESDLVSQVDGEELGKFFRFALETAKIDNFLKGIETSKTVPIITEGLLAERRDVAGLARLLGVNNKTDPSYVGSPSELVEAQAAIISLVNKGQVDEKDLQKALSWLHTADVELTDVRRERATFKTFDHETGVRFSAEKIAENKAKFEIRSKGNTRRYIATQVVEELGEFLEEHLKTTHKPSANIFKVIEAQKRALKAIRFGNDTVIKDVDSAYYGKTNQEAAKIAAKAAGVEAGTLKPEALVTKLNVALEKELRIVPKITGDVYRDSNLDALDNYKTALALEQDASSSGAQIIALTTRNKQLAELSNVVPTNQKQRLYDEIAASTFNDPRFRELNKRLGLTEKDLRKASKAQNMVTFYGAGERTGILNVEDKLAKILGKDTGTLVVKAAERDAVLNEISARAARYKDWDRETFNELMALRKDVKDIFNKGETVGDDLMSQLYFLDSKTKDMVEKMTRQYNNVVSPDDFKLIASIMSENLRSQVPVLKDFTRFFGRLAEDFVVNADPKKSAFDWAAYLKSVALDKPLEKKPKKWTQVPWVNFDGNIIEQHFTQVFEEKLVYKDKLGNWVTNILQVPQKTDPGVIDEWMNRPNKINDIVDAQKARTAFAVNGNHSNDAVLVKKFHLWGRGKKIDTATVHDAFVTNAQDMLEARSALKEIYAGVLDANVIEKTLKEMYDRGLPRKLYYQYLNEAIDIGLIPVVGRSKIGGKTLKNSDILLKSDILEKVPAGFKSDRGWYGIG